MSIKFLNKGVGTLVTNNDCKITAFVVEKLDDNPSELSALLIDLDLGAVDNLNDVFHTSTNLSIPTNGDQPTIVKWNNSEKLPVAAIGLSSGFIALVNPHANVPPTNINTGSNSAISGLEFSHQDPIIANISQGGYLSLVDIPTSNITNLCVDASSTGFNSTVAWNHRVGHILATNKFGGNANIWDIKLKKVATSFGNNINFSSVQWIPEQATQLITGSFDLPVIQLWDLRNTSSPVKEFEAPCPVKNITFSPHNHSIFTATTTNSNDQLMLWNMDLVLQNSILLDTEPTLSFSQSYITWSQYNPSLVLWNSSDSITLTNIYSGAKVSEIPHLNTVKYGIATGFASRIVTFGDSKLVAYKAICELAKVDMSITENDATACKIICETKAKSKGVDDLDRTSWLVTSALFSSNRNSVLSAIGLDVDSVITTAKELLGETVESNDLKQETDDPEEFFRELGQRAESDKTEEKPHFVYEGTKLPQEISKSLDDCISIGDLGIAADLCLMAGRAAEALLLAHGAGADEWNRISRAIVSNSKDPLINKIAMLTSGDLETLVSNADLKEWKLILASICTFSDNNNFATHCSSLAKRLLNSGMKNAAVVCHQVAGNVNEAFESWYDSPEPMDVKVLRMAMFQRASRTSPSGDSLNKFVSLVSNMSEKLAQSGYITEAMGLLSIVQPQQMVEVQVYRISQLYGGAMTNPPYSLIPISLAQGKAVKTGLDMHSQMQTGLQQNALQSQRTANIPVQSRPVTSRSPAAPQANQPLMPTSTPVTASPMPQANSSLRTTAPDAVFHAIYPSMPLPWPLPTPTQQMGSETASIDANAKTTPKSPPAPPGVAMPPSDYSIVNSTIKGLVVNALINESSLKKANEIQLRIDQLFDAIKSCRLSQETNKQLVDLCKAIEAADYVTAGKMVNSISSTAWDSNNKGWIMVLKRLVPRN